MRRILPIFLLVTLLSATALFAEGTALLVTVTGERLSGSVTLSDGVFTVTTEGGRRELKAEMADRIRLTPVARAPEAPPDCVLFLEGGGMLEGFLLPPHEEAEAVPLSLPGFGAVSVPLDKLSGIFFWGKARGRSMLADASARLARDRDTENDRIVLADGDVLKGIVVSLSREGLVAEIDGRRLTIEPEKASLVAFARLPGRAERISSWHALLTTVYGSVVPVVPKSLDARTLSGDFRFGGHFDVPLDVVRSMEFFGGAAVHLSRMKPSKVEEIPYYAVPRHFRVNRSVSGNPLTVAGRRFERGFGVHSLCRLHFELKGEYFLFLSQAGIDDETGGRGSVVFRVLGDGRELYSSCVIGAGKLLDIRADVSGVSHLVLEVNYGDDDDLGDHADWADPRLVRRLK